jgi:hypothetical protein
MRRIIEPVIFDARIGSLASIGVSTTRRPFAVRSAILLKGPGGNRFLRPWHLAQRQGAKLTAEPQRFCCNDDGLRYHRLSLRLQILRAHFSLAVQPGLRDENGEEAEDNGEADHDYGA